MKLEFKTECDECDSSVDVVFDVNFRDEIVLTITPCVKCLDTKYREGYDDGYSEGHDDGQEAAAEENNDTK